MLWSTIFHHFCPFFQYTIAKSQNGVRGHHVLFDVGLEALVRGIGSFYTKPPMEGPLVLIWSRPNRVLEDRAMRKNQKRNGQVFFLWKKFFFKSTVFFSFHVFAFKSKRMYMARVEWSLITRRIKNTVETQIPILWSRK